jgi:hypothetical protein
MTMIDQLPAAMQTVRTRPLFVLSVEVSGLHLAGGPAGAERRVGDLPGGSFAGERLSGIVLPGGTDWQTMRSDDAILLDARILLRTDDDALIAMTYTGMRHAPPDIAARMTLGLDVDPASHYFRIAPTFATSAPRYEWLNRIVAIGIGHRLAAGPVYSVFEIL